MDEETKVKDAADRIIELGHEVEAAGHAALDAPTVQQARAILHQWIDGMKGVVVHPAFGRVVVIDEHGSATTIASSDLAFRMCAAGITQSG
jgi:hypothetical protein